MPLLTNDPGEVRLLTNKTLRLLALVNDRVEHEFPQLEGLARQTMERIEAEYGRP